MQRIVRESIEAAKSIISKLGVEKPEVQERRFRSELRQRASLVTKKYQEADRIRRGLEKQNAPRIGETRVNLGGASVQMGETPTTTARKETRRGQIGDWPAEQDMYQQTAVPPEELEFRKTAFQAWEAKQMVHTLFNTLYRSGMALSELIQLALNHKYYLGMSNFQKEQFQAELQEVAAIHQNAFGRAKGS